MLVVVLALNIYYEHQHHDHESQDLVDHALDLHHLEPELLLAKDIMEQVGMLGNKRLLSIDLKQQTRGSELLCMVIDAGTTKGQFSYSNHVPSEVGGIHQ